MVADKSGTNSLPFGLSESQAARVRINALKILYTLKAEQEGIEGKIKVTDITHKRKAAATA